MIGTTLQDRYVLTGELGRGGMGVVYRARDPVLGREVAVKLIPPAHVSPETEERFRREAQLVAQMDHPGIVPIYDFGRHDESLYLVMPVVPGSSLRPFLDERSLTVGDVVDVGIAVAEALEHSHALGVVHRDVKPENIMIARDKSGGLRVRVMDFGLARVATSSLTETGVLVGTMAYASPEQITGQELGHRCDIYALGTVLYECLTGRPPFAGEMQSILYRIVHEMPEPPSLQGIDIDEEFEHTILQCLAKAPGERPQRAGVVAESFRRVRYKLRDSDRNKSVVTTSPVQTRQQASPFVGRKQELAALQQRLNTAIQGECQLVVVGGEPGSGKTRLLDEIENLAHARHLRVLHGRFVEQHSFPYQGFCEAIQEYFRQEETGSSSAGLPDFSDLAPDLVTLFPMLAEIEVIRGSSTASSRIDHAAPESPANRAQVFEFLARAFIRMAGGKPLVLLLEDMHGAEASIEALQYMIPRLGPTPTLIIGTYRTTDVDRHHPLARMLDAFEGDRRFESIELGSFNESEHRLFLETLLGGPELSSDLVGSLYQRTEGNPFFTKELVRSLLESKAIGQDETGTWSLSGQAQIDSGALPVTIQQAVEKRIQRLPPDLRDILSLAAVLGKTFDFREFEELASDKGDVDDAVDRLVQEGLLQEVPGARSDLLTFGSSMVRDVLYAELSRRKRRSLHRKCARQIEKRHLGRLERVYPELLSHYSEGDVPEKTVEYGVELARVSLKSFSPEEAIRASKLALEFLDEEWEGNRALEGQARLLLARALRMTGDIDSALFEAGRAGDVFGREQHPGWAAKALVFAAETAWQARRPEETGTLVERGILAARAAEELESLGQLLSLGATLANLRGEYERANQLLHEAEELNNGDNGLETEEALPRGGRLIVPLSMPVHAKTPSEFKLDDEVEVLSNVFETLLATDEESNVVPRLCENWQVGEKGDSLRLFLRAGVRFHDGHALAAADVKRSIEEAVQRGVEMPAAFRAIFGFEEFQAGRSDALEGLVAQSERTLEIRLSEQLPAYPAMLTDVATAIVRELPDGSPVGTGPYKVASFEPERVVLERNEHYWTGAAPALDAVEFRPYMSPRAIASGIRSGELDLARDLVPEELDSVLRDPRFRQALVETPKRNISCVVFNSSTGLLAEHPPLRRALAGAVRATELVWQTLDRFSQPATCFLPPGVLGHDAARERRPVQRQAARSAIQSTGLPLPIRLPVAVHPTFKDRCGKLLESLFEIWSDLGVECSIETDSMAAFLEAADSGQGTALLFTRWNADYYDPHNYSFHLYHSSVGQLRHWFRSKRSDQLLEQASHENRPAERELAYRTWDRLLEEEALLVPLFHDIDYRIAGPRVRGLKLCGTAPYVNYAELGKASATDSSPHVRVGPTGTIHVPMAGDVHSLESSKWRSSEEAEVTGIVFETLTKQVEGARIVPALAASFRVENGGAKYRFHLRRSIRFHDGRPVTARDVRFSFERALEKGFGVILSPVQGAREFVRGEVPHLSGFTIHSAHEFTIELEKPVSFFPVLVSHTAAGILPEGTKSLGDSWQRGCIGTGPFRVVKFEPGRRMELERSPYYWRAGTPKSERVVFSFNEAPKEILEGFRSGKFSLCSDLFPADFEKLCRDSEFGSGYRETPDLSTYFVAFNRNSARLGDADRRRRLCDAVDVPALVRQTLGRLAIPANGLIPPGLLGHDPGIRSPIPAPRSQDPLELTAAVHPLFLGKYAALLERVLHAFEAVGAKVEAINETMPDFLKAIDDGAVDLVIGRWKGDYPDSDSFVHALVAREGFLGSFCGSVEIDGLVAAGRPESDPTARHAIYRGIEEIIRRDALLLPLFHSQLYRFARPEIEGLSVSSTTPIVRYEELRVRS